MTIRREIERELDRMPLEQQQKVLDFTHAIIGTAVRLKGVPGRNLLRFSGVLSPEEAESIRQIIEANCERVDNDEW